MKIASYIAGIILLLNSCTIVTSTNAPGKPEKAFPKSMIGSYELIYPESFQGMMEGAEMKTTIEIKSDELIMNSGEGDSHMKINDSISINKLGKQYYLCMGRSPVLNVFKVVKKDKDFEFHSMNAKEGVTADQLRPFFSEVTTTSDLDEETGEITDSYTVKIDDKKIDSYYKSDIIHVEPFTLKRVK
ncbi:hypothetical protein [Fluviicola taffensis]|uniref:Uncharacterized protein n=1 Tax=Fluviicola taffensis (strain DSM 16823 / NCIMB 13979 / RW262) TaxID=755732 RepID=F2IJM9_FLUTR|nr:hypothetical protein [Fluviicola taffensis]AEA43919.1 hypothetical protein Fluta_1932 [Fluviicola taffensis DSM 16823]